MKSDFSKGPWIDNQDGMQMLKVSARTLFNYRSQGILPYSKIGSRIYYRLNDIEQLLQKNYLPAFRKEVRNEK